MGDKEETFDLTMNGREIMVVTAALHAFRHHHPHPDVIALVQSLDARVLKLIDTEELSAKTFTTTEALSAACEVGFSCTLQAMVGEMLRAVMAAMTWEDEDDTPAPPSNNILH